ncbi:MAG: DEAD/DEAH box helicase [Vicinamibacterales bacterium]
MRRWEWTGDAGGVTFRCLENGAPQPIDTWATAPVVSESGTPVQPGLLLAMANAGAAEEIDDDTAIRLSADRVAALQAWEARALGLPSASPFSLMLERSGLFHEKAFTLRYRFVNEFGLPVQSARRVGPILHTGESRFLVHEPLYSVAIAVDELAASGAATMEARAPWLERIQSLLGGEGDRFVGADAYLREMKITSAHAFSLQPRVDAGGVDFDVVPARVPRGETAGAVEAALPPAREADWNRYFRRLPVRRCYMAGDGHLLVVSPELEKVLGIARKMTSADDATKRAFVRNPRTFLREALPDLPEPALDTVFWESAAYSERVRDIGLWQPRVLPFLKREGNNWFPEAMGLQVNGELVPVRPEQAAEVLSRLEQAKAEGKPWIELEGTRVPVTDEAIEAARELDRFARVFGVGDQKPDPADVEDEPTPTGKVVLLVKDNLEAEGYVRNWQPRPDVPGPTVPAALRTTLFDFQQQGCEWLQALWRAGAPGGLLADDMGLGKTVQTLAFLAWLRQALGGHRHTGPILTVAPTGLLRNWIAEHDRHLGDAGLGEIVEAHGPGLADLRLGAVVGGELAAGVPTLDTARLQSADWVLTTYETLRDYQHSFGTIRWSVLVLDEAQKVKNPQALMTEAVKALNAAFTIALTGTPVENRLADLWCIVDTVEPGRLGSLKAFVEDYEAGEGDASRLGVLKHRLTHPSPPLLQRRTKKGELKGLPEIHYHAERVQMPAEQASSYSEALAQARELGRGGMLKALQRLRAVSLHPHTELAGGDEAFVAASARLTRAFDILQRLQGSGEKAIVFVEALEMQAALIELLQRRFGLRKPPLSISGEVPGGRRLARVEAFQSEPGFGVMLLSPRAGGVGLTITEANHVIHLSRWWNPAVEDQATDRVYRIGQRRPVHVYTPLAVHPTYGEASFDLRLHELLERKRSLSRDLLAPPDATSAELEGLYRDTLSGQGMSPGTS